MATQASSVDQADPRGSAFGDDQPPVLVAGDVYHVNLFVRGKPVAKARPRTTRTGHTYTPENTVTWEQEVAWQVREQLARVIAQGIFLPTPFLGRVIVEMRFNFDKPKSEPKRVQHKLKKPDYDNLAKSITDVLQNVRVYKDDAQITDSIIKKRFSDEAHPQGVEISLTCWASGA